MRAHCKDYEYLNILAMPMQQVLFHVAVLLSYANKYESPYCM